MQRHCSPLPAPAEFLFARAPESCESRRSPYREPARRLKKAKYWYGPKTCARTELPAVPWPQVELQSLFSWKLMTAVAKVHRPKQFGHELPRRTTTMQASSQSEKPMPKTSLSHCNRERQRKMWQLSVRYSLSCLHPTSLVFFSAFIIVSFPHSHGGFSK